MVAEPKHSFVMPRWSTQPGLRVHVARKGRVVLPSHATASGRTTAALLGRSRPLGNPCRHRGSGKPAADLLYREASPHGMLSSTKDDRDLQSLVERCQWLRAIAPDMDLPDLSESVLQEICRELCEALPFDG